MASACMILNRGICTSAVFQGKRNFRKFLLYNKRGSRLFKEEQSKRGSDFPIDHRGVRHTGYWLGNQWVSVPEMIPEIIVPSLEGFKLKPYVTYKVTDFTQREFTARDLFNAVYADKIKQDFQKGELLENGEPVNPSESEKLTPEEAKILAQQTGTDIF